MASGAAVDKHVAEPHEEFEATGIGARLIAAAGEAVISELPTSVLDAAQEMLKGEGGKPASGDLIDQGKKVIDLLSPFLKAP